MTRFRIVPGRSRVETTVSSSVHPIHASGEGLRGWIEGEIGADGGPNFDVSHGAALELPVEALGSGNRLQDVEMQRRLDARRYPLIEVRVRRAWLDGAGGGARAAFDVTAHGRSRPYEEGFTLRTDGGRVVIEGEHQFDMRDFGVNPPRFFTLKVSPEVRVKVRIEAEAEAAAGR